MSRQIPSVLKFSTLLKASVAGFVLLSVAGCKPADKGQGALKSAGVEALNLSKADTSVFGKYFETDACETEEMEALGALAGLGLGESGANGLEFTDRTFDNGQVVYSDVIVTNDEATTFSADRVTFHCPQMGDAAPNFARLDLADVLLTEDGTTFTFETLSVANPTDSAAKALVDGVTGVDRNRDGEVGFGAISLTNAKMTGETINAELSALVWGEDRDEDNEGTADLMVGDLNATLPGDNGAKDMIVKFAGMSARNMHLGGESLSQVTPSANGALGQVLGKMNVFEKPYDELIIGELDIESEGFNVDFDGIEGKTTESGDVITTRQTLKPMTLTFHPALGDTSEFAQVYGILESLDFQTLEMSGSSVSKLNKKDDSVSVSDGLFVIKDALRLNFEYEAEGLAEMVAKVKASEGSSDESKLMSAYEPLKLRSMRFTMEDNSIVERGLKLASLMTGQDPKTIKRGLGFAVFAVAGIAENDVQSEVYSETVSAFADFVKDGGTLTIEANPPAPFPLAPLITGKGDDVDPTALGFSASQSSETP